MRIATRTIYGSMQERIVGLSGQMQILNEKVANGKDLNRPSDDPIGLVDAMQLKTAMAQMNQYGRNVNAVKDWTQLSESALSQTFDLIGTAQEIAMQTATDTMNAQSRASAAVEVGNLLDQAIGLANSNINGEYIFAGYETHTVPFSRVTAGGIETAEYNGDLNDFRVQIGEGNPIVAGRNGQAVFMSSGLFDALGNLKKALEDNDQAGISAQVTALKSSSDVLNNQLADIGARDIRLDDRQEILEQTISDFQTRLSDVEDADISEVLIELKSKELAYQAALLSSARMNELTLMDYLR